MKKRITAQKSATETVKAHLIRHGKITQLDCLSLCGSWRLSDIIYRLRKSGMSIDMTMKEVKTRYDKKTSVSTYHFKNDV